MSIAEKPRRLEEALHARENDLPKLLDNSRDAIVVMNMELRFVAANPKALDVFGISEKNIAMFSMDAFLPRAQILCLDDNGTLLMSRKEWNGECTIRRLDGSLRAAEFIFVTKLRAFSPFVSVPTIASGNAQNGAWPKLGGLSIRRTK